MLKSKIKINQPLLIAVKFVSSMLNLNPSVLRLWNWVERAEEKHLSSYLIDWRILTGWLGQFDGIKPKVGFIESNFKRSFHASTETTTFFSTSLGIVHISRHILKWTLRTGIHGKVRIEKLDQLRPYSHETFWHTILR